MKKLKLKLDGKEMLSKEQMKKISGGYGLCSVRANSGAQLDWWCNTTDCELCEQQLHNIFDGSGWTVDGCECF